MRDNKLWKKRGQKNDTFGIGQINQHRTFKQPAAWHDFCHRLEINCATGSPLLNAQPDQVCGPGPFEHFKGQHRL
ncbi:hypothetical protein BG55_15350 [Erwinia mallotivora]|uniref:Uncharacterized protein n=1 Tax=Erwinia mallotivora TaxID=69222 RepID=A0A014NLV0_9GAMM|nr:hypothetical protein BG55_15350 [Erwinia mallotivora]